MRDPAHGQRHQDARDAIEETVPVRELENVGADADLADHQRRGLRAHHVAVADQQHLDDVAADRHVRREAYVGTEQRVAEEIHVDPVGYIELLCDLLPP